MSVDPIARGLAVKALTNPVGTAATYTVTPNGTTAQTLLKLQLPAEANNTEGYQDVPEFAIKIARSTFVTPDSYTDNVFGIGWNLTSAFAPADANHPASSFRIETKYKFTGTPGAIVQAEFHVAHWTKGTGSQEMRPITIGAPHVYADWVDKSAISFTSAQYQFNPGDNTSGTFLTFVCNASTRRADFTNFALRQSANNLAWLQQQNSSGTPVNMPYVNAGNALQGGLPLYVQTTATLPTNPLIGAQCYESVQIGSTLSTGFVGRYMSWPAVTGSINPMWLSGSTSTLADILIQNTHASGKNGMTFQGKGIQYFGFFDDVNFRYGGMRFLSADGTLRIGIQYQGGVQAGGDAMVIANATAQVTFLYPPKLPSYTVVGLLSASTVGAGAEAFCTNETGGAVTVFSDGTNWRRVTDRAIAA